MKLDKSCRETLFLLISQEKKGEQWTTDAFGIKKWRQELRRRRDETPDYYDHDTIQHRAEG